MKEVTETPRIKDDFADQCKKNLSGLRRFNSG